MTGIILAAGKSKRMGLTHSKMLLPLQGRPVIGWVIDLAHKAKLNPIIVVISPDGTEIKEKCYKQDVRFVIQPEAKGTADAVRVCIPYLSDNDDIFILYGDVPCLKLSTVQQLIDNFYKEKVDVTLLTVHLDDPSAYGRIVRNEKKEIIAIIEYNDASVEIRKIKEINTGVYAFRYSKLKPILENLKPSPINNEYYLTTAISEIINQGGKVTSVMTETPDESYGINTPEDWEKVQKAFVFDNQ
jgi:bifunctional UDP-N-acetylglucosamine pyrophosphorylase/glucosamine-1-phosphate N-acetyltransferase